VSRRQETSAHWGTYVVEVSEDDRDIVAASVHPDDPDAAPAIGNVADTHRHPGWRGRACAAAGSRTAQDPTTVAVTLARSTSRSAGTPRSICSPANWSAGRLHHAQSQLHRFLNTIGGYTRSVNDYSRGASMVLLPHLIGPAETLDLRYMLPGVAQMHTGAWVRPERAGGRRLRQRQRQRPHPRCRHLDADTGDQRCPRAGGRHRYDGPVPPVRAYEPPTFS
jgi:hypothetical protein